MLLANSKEYVIRAGMLLVQVQVQLKLFGDTVVWGQPLQPGR